MGPEGPYEDGKRWVAIDRRSWQDPRSGYVWEVVAWAETDVPPSAPGAASSSGATVLLVFDGFHHHHVVEWSEPEPLGDLSNGDFQELLGRAKARAAQ